MNSTDKAVDRVKEGKAWAAITIPANFSMDLIERGALIKARQPVPAAVINGSTIEIYEDVTS